MVSETLDLNKKSRYFSSLALGVKPAFRQHINEGLLGGKTSEFRNISAHCLVEVARTGIFAEVLKFSDEITRKLKISAAVHDIYKPEQIKFFEAGNITFQSFLAQAEKSHAKMTKLVGSEIAEIAGSEGSESLLEIEPLVSKPELSEHELARLVMFYVDAYTIKDTWTSSKENASDQTVKNDIDRRFEGSERDSRYFALNETSRSFFNGETHFVRIKRVSHQIEDRLADEIYKRSRVQIDPLDLPEFIDNKIKQKINTM